MYKATVVLLITFAMVPLYSMEQMCGREKQEAVQTNITSLPADIVAIVMKYVASQSTIAEAYDAIMNFLISNKHFNAFLDKPAFRDQLIANLYEIFIPPYQAPWEKYSEVRKAVEGEKEYDEFLAAKNILYSTIKFVLAVPEKFKENAYKEFKKWIGPGQGLDLSVELGRLSGAAEEDSGENMQLIQRLMTCIKDLAAKENRNLSEEEKLKFQDVMDHPLVAAARTNVDLDTIKLLVSLDGDIDAITEDEESTALHHAVDNKNYDVAKFLISKSADVNKQDDDGSTPLHLAIEKDAYDIIKLLLRHNADPYIEDEHGDNAFDLAGHDAEMIEIFEDWRKVNPEIVQSIHINKKSKKEFCCFKREQL